MREKDRKIIGAAVAAAVLISTALLVFIVFAQPGAGQETGSADQIEVAEGRWHDFDPRMQSSGGTGTRVSTTNDTSGKVIAEVLNSVANVRTARGAFSATASNITALEYLKVTFTKATAEASIFGDADTTDSPGYYEIYQNSTGYECIAQQFDLHRRAEVVGGWSYLRFVEEGAPAPSPFWTELRKNNDTDDLPQNPTGILTSNSTDHGDYVPDGYSWRYLHFSASEVVEHTPSERFYWLVLNGSKLSRVGSDEDRISVRRISDSANGDLGRVARYDDGNDWRSLGSYDLSMLLVAQWLDGEGAPWETENASDVALELEYNGVKKTTTGETVVFTDFDRADSSLDVTVRANVSCSVSLKWELIYEKVEGLVNVSELESIRGESPAWSPVKDTLLESYGWYAFYLIIIGLFVAAVSVKAGAAGLAGGLVFMGLVIGGWLLHQAFLPGVTASFVGAHNGNWQDWSEYTETNDLRWKSYWKSREIRWDDYWYSYEVRTSEYWGSDWWVTSRWLLHNSQNWAAWEDYYFTECDRYDEYVALRNRDLNSTWRGTWTESFRTWQGAFGEWFSWL